VEVGTEPGSKAEPNNDTFCAVFRGLSHNNGQDLAPGSSIEMFGKVTSAMMNADIFIGPKIMTYGLEMFLMDGELDSVRYLTYTSS
jgi:hypothetical protein